MTRKQYNRLSDTGKIGIKPPDLPIEVKPVTEFYMDEIPKKLTKANSFLILDEVFVISRKDYNGRSKKVYFIYRASDGRLMCAIPLDDKNECIKLATKKYLDYKDKT